MHTATADRTAPAEGSIRTLYGIAVAIAEACFPSLDADIAESTAEGMRRAEFLLDSGRGSHRNLFEPPLDGEYRAPSIQLLSSLIAISDSSSFAPLAQAVQHRRAAQLVALYRSWGVQDAAIPFRAGVMPWTLTSPPPCDEEIEVLRDECAAVAVVILRSLGGADAPGLPPVRDILAQFLSAY